MRRFIIAIAVALASGAASAQESYQRIGPMTYGSDGSTAQQIGNQQYYSYPTPRPGAPNSSQDIGNTRYYDNGVTRQSIGSQDYYSNGTTRQRIGNTDYYSDPNGNQRTCQHIGNQTFCN